MAKFYHNIWNFYFPHLVNCTFFIYGEKPHHRRNGPWWKNKELPRTSHIIKIVKLLTNYVIGCVIKVSYYCTTCCWWINHESLSSGTKGQIIFESFFGVFNFFQKRNENKSTRGIIGVKSNSFFGRNVGLKKSFWLCLTFK